ncbi:MAG: hypothetical protein ACE14S_06915 [Candidatus Bathyarchaeia archaeon]
MKKKEFKRINVTEKTENQIRYTARLLNKTISGFLSELFEQIFQEAGNFKLDGGANLTYIHGNDDLSLQFSGAKMIITGRFQAPIIMTDSEVDKKILAETQKAFESAEKANKETFSESG